jgi:hypothetical protein
LALLSHSLSRLTLFTPGRTRTLCATRSFLSGQRGVRVACFLVFLLWPLTVRATKQSRVNQTSRPSSRTILHSSEWLLQYGLGCPRFEQHRCTLTLHCLSPVVLHFAVREVAVRAVCTRTGAARTSMVRLVVTPPQRSLPRRARLNSTTPTSLAKRRLAGKGASFHFRSLSLAARVRE